jgi:ribosomal protein S2
MGKYIFKKRKEMHVLLLAFKKENLRALKVIREQTHYR